jgi:1-pyrroline dehydrogenase
MQTQLLIGGRLVAGEGASESVLDAARGTQIAAVPGASEAQVDAAVAAAEAAFHGWSATAPRERATLLLRVAERIDADAAAYAALESRNTGKPLAAALADELPAIADVFRFFAGVCRAPQGLAAGEYLPGHTSMIRRDPVGVVASIAPWNYPLMMAIWKFGPALAAGNTVVLKPAETTPITTIRLAELAAEILPKGVLNIVTGPGRPTGEALINHPDVDMIALTGSVDTGKHFARTAADTLKRVHLELGGKAPVVVFDDVSLESALETIAGTGYYNAGQDCTAATRVLASSSVYDNVVSGLATQAQGLVIGDTLAPGTTLGPVNSAKQRERVEGFLQRRPAHAEIVTGGGQPDREGFFLEPTVVAGLEQEDELIQKEIFGPVITVQQFTDEEQAIERANATRWHHRCGRVTWAGRCACPRRCGLGAYGSTTTSRSFRRCLMAGSSSRDTARI